MDDSLSAVPIVDVGAQMGTLVLKRTPEGYEARAYRLPTGLATGVMATVPVEDCELLWAGLYGLEDRRLIRMLDV